MRYFLFGNFSLKSFIKKYFKFDELLIGNYIFRICFDNGF